MHWTYGTSSGILPCSHGRIALQPTSLKKRVLAAYSAAAASPGAEHPFPLGRRFLESIGYPGDLVGRLPAVAVEAFTGVAPLPLLLRIPEGARVLDLGCGAGVDALIASRLVGAGGSVVGIDLSPTMLERARRAAATAQATNIRFLRADAERLPLKTASIDLALVNGLFNLVPDRAALFGELARVVRPGGVVHVAELILERPLDDKFPENEDNWFS